MREREALLGALGPAHLALRLVGQLLEQLKLARLAAQRRERRVVTRDERRGRVVLEDAAVVEDEDLVEVDDRAKAVCARGEESISTCSSEGGIL